ncbi:MAG TPA: glycosyltransferase family 39 protein [Bacteroidales bacterium]|jgi:4-amino-4-deoxy-L-arabinose transferase-like glycosyltransferase|nr:glycosyltransferase family 39 protein [Bacteroidales bacterium]
MNGKPENTRIYNLLIAVVAALLFIPFLGGVHLFDWDEINFAESAREMIASGDYLTVQINFIPFWEKPPLFIWMQVASMKVFGINEFAARLPNAICGIITLLVLFNIGKRIRDVGFGTTWVLMYAGSMLPFLYFKSGIIDPFFNLFIFTGIYRFHLYFESPQNRMRNAVISAVLIGLAILTKGPVALLIFLLTFGVFMVVPKFRVNIRLKDVMAFVIVLIFTGGFWFILQIMQGNFGIIADFVQYQIRLFNTQDAGHGGFLLYHFVVLLIGVFPASILALPALLPAKYSSIKDNAFYIWMLILFWVVLLLFTIVRTKIVHYSSLCYFPLTFLASWAIYYSETSFTRSWRKVVVSFILSTGLIIALIIIGLTFLDEYKQALIEFLRIKDPFGIANLSADGEWRGFEFLTGLLLIAGLTVFLILFRRRFEHAVRILNVFVGVFMFFSMLLIAPRVEAYSQRAVIEFFKSVSDEDAYLLTVGYKSYAHLFYGKVRDHSSIKDSYEKDWLLQGEINKPVYVSAKITRKEKMMKDYPQLKLLYEKNGFVFFKRLPVSTSPTSDSPLVSKLKLI